MYKAKHKTVSLIVTCLTFLFTLLMAFTSLFTVPTVNVASAATTTITDTLNRATTGANGTSYITWSGKTSNSNAVYAGQSAGDHEAIQLRSKNSNSGIVTTQSGGRVAKITVVWNSNTASARTLDIYGKNTAYEAATELYKNTTQGTKLGSIKCGTADLTVTGDYQYIGLRSNDGALYLDSVSIEWKVESSEPDCTHTNWNWAFDSETNEHYQKCNNPDCGAEIADTRVACTYDSYSYTKNENGTHTKKGTCTVCGTEATINASETCSVNDTWSAWTSNENGTHTRTGSCQYCNATITETNDCEVTSSGYVRNGDEHSQTGVCGVCGDETTVTEDCTLTYANVSNEDGTHTMTSTCSVCQQSSEPETINCSFEKSLEGSTLTYTCKYCEYSYTEDATMFTVTYVVPSGITAPEAVDVAVGYTTNLATAAAPEDYTFVGWTTEKVEKSDSKPATVYAANYELIVTEDITLYALYSYTEKGTEKWTKVTDVNDLAVGKEIIIVNAAGNKALSTNQKNNNRAAVDFNESEVSDDVQIITLEKGTKTGTFAFNVGTGYLYAAHSEENYLRTGAKSDNAAWLITIDKEGVADIVAQGNYTRNQVRYNPNTNNGTPLFACYASTSTTGSLPSIYMMAGDKYYTTGKTVETEITGVSLTVGESLTVNYYATILEADMGAKLIVTFKGETIELEGTLVEGNLYVFSFDIAPQDMAEEIYAELKLDSTVYSTDTYSVQAYAEDVLAGDYIVELKKLVTDMLNYGAEAQNFTNANTATITVLGTPSNATPDEDDNVFSYTTNKAGEQYFLSADVWFGNVNKLAITINVPDDAVITVNGGADFEIDGNVLYTSGILATEFDKEFTFVVTCGDVVQTLTYSVNSYLFAMQDKEAIVDLANALYNYGVSADKYALKK